MITSKNLLESALDKAINQLAESEAVELQEMLIYFSRIKSNKRRRLLLNIIQETLYRDMALRKTGRELEPNEAKIIRNVVLEKDKALSSAAWKHPLEAGFFIFAFQTGLTYFKKRELRGLLCAVLIAGHVWKLFD